MAHAADSAFALDVEARPDVVWTETKTPTPLPLATARALVFVSMMTVARCCWGSLSIVFALAKRSHSKRMPPPLVAKAAVQHRRFRQYLPKNDSPIATSRRSFWKRAQTESYRDARSSGVLFCGHDSSSNCKCDDHNGDTDRGPLRVDTLGRGRVSVYAGGCCLCCCCH